MNAEEYIVERIKMLEKTNDSLKFLIDNQTTTINNLSGEIKAYKDLLEKAQLEFKDGESYYGINFKGLHLTLTDKGKENVKAIINDLKILNLYEDIILEVEKREQNQ